MFNIKHEKEHFNIYLDGQFYCSADTESEAEMEIKEYLMSGGNGNEK